MKTFLKLLLSRQQGSNVSGAPCLVTARSWTEVRIRMVATVLEVIKVMALVTSVTSEARRDTEAEDYRRTYGADLGHEIHPNR